MKKQYVWLLSVSGREHLGYIDGGEFTDMNAQRFRHNPERHRIREATPEEVTLIESSLAAVEERRAQRFIKEQVDAAHAEQRRNEMQREEKEFFLACKKLKPDDIVVARLRFDAGLYVKVACAIIKNFPGERKVQVETYNQKKRTWTPRKSRVGYSSLCEICPARRMPDGSLEDVEGLPVLPGQLDTGRVKTTR